MLICLLLGTVLQWTISSRELIRTEYGRYHQQWVWQWRSGCLILSLNYEKNLHFFLNLSSGLKIIHQFVKVDRNVYKSSNKSFMIHTNQLLLFSNWPELSPWSFTHVHVFKKIETTVRWNCMSKALRLVQITVEHQDCPFFTVFLTIKTLSQNISITLLQISLKLHEHRGRYWRKKLPWTILEEQFPVPWNIATSKVGNSVISLLW